MAPRTFLTSDLHLGHVRIPELAHRPYSDVSAMDEDLVRRWNAVVAPSDVVWVLGDWCLGRIAETLPLTQRFHGRKVLVPGNHDRCWQGHGRGSHEWRQRYVDAGFAEVVDDPVEFDVAVGSAGAGSADGGSVTRVRLSHFPFRGGGDSLAVERYSEHRLVDDGGWLLHGHVHTVWRQRGRQVNVGVDAWGGVPVALEQVAELLAAGPADLAPLPWPPPDA